MANLERKQQKIFAENSQSTQVTAFRTAGGTPLYSKDVDEIQNANFSVGWLEEDNAGNVTPYAEDMNGVFYSFTRNLAYLYQKGIPEWSNSETYYTNAMCMYGGVLYQSLLDNNTNRQPDTQTTYWKVYASPISGSVVGADNLGTGAGISTGVVSSKIQLKSLVAGTNVSLVEGDDSITINSDGGGGGSSTVAWGDITGSISSQVDLATALSQKGTLSGNNEWTGTNYFAGAYPRSNGGNLGSSSYVWTSAYITSVYTSTIRGSTSLSLISDNTNGYGFNLQTNRTVGGNSVYSFESNTGSVRSSLGYPDKLITYGFVDTTIGYRLNGATTAGVIIGYYDSLANFNLTNVCTVGRNTVSSQGIYPSSVSGMTSQIGSNSSKWGEAYITTVNSTTLSATTLTLGGTSYTSIPAAANNGSYAIKMNNATKGTVYADGTGTNTIDLGTVITALPSTRVLKINNTDKVTVYCTSSGGAIDFGSYLPLSGGTMTGNIIPSASGSKYLGAANAKWEVHASHVYCPSYNLDNCQIYHIGTDTGSVQIGWLNGANAVALYMKSGSVYPYSNQSLTLGTSSNRWSTIYGIGAVNTSDRRKKHDIIELENALEKLNTVKVKSYTMDGIDYGVNYGMIAQDEIERNPELVFVPDNYSEEEDGGELGFINNNVLFLAVKAIQELSAKVEDLEKKLKEN